LVVAVRINVRVERRQDRRNVDPEPQDEACVVPPSIFDLMVPTGVAMDARKDEFDAFGPLDQRSGVPIAAPALEQPVQALAARPLLLFGLHHSTQYPEPSLAPPLTFGDGQMLTSMPTRALPFGSVPHRATRSRGVLADSSRTSTHCPQVSEPPYPF
jgi:hypothetical protein